MRPMRWLIGLALVAVLGAYALYRVQIGEAYRRIAGAGERVATPFGDVEFVSGGSGAPVLVIHGSGGGHDQGALIAKAVVGDGFRWIAPSRFGYLGSALPPGASFETQADAYARLLDALGIGRVAVVAMSQGGPSALFFALKHPERVTALVLISCGVAADSGPEQQQASANGDRLTTIFQHDALYWLASTAFRGPLMELMGASPAVIEGLSAEQRRTIDEVIRGMNPVRPRAAGVVLDNRAAMPNERIAAIRAPTLIFHATDDGLQRYRNAAYAAATIPGAQLRRFDRGGHLLIAVEQASVREQTQAFLRAHGQP